MLKHAIIAALLISGGAALARKPAPTDWRAVATAGDTKRLHDWRDAFVQALGEARTAGKQAELAREGMLVSPDVALARPLPPPGKYRCRTIKLGNGSTETGSGSGLGFVAYPAFDCQVAVENDVSSLSKTSGSQRFVGLLFHGGDRHETFLGTAMLGDEIRSLQYGRDPDRDMVGAVERIGPQRWRLILPYPRFESTLDIVELVPAS
ncbi:MAG: DUF4893 domain-containing protein [Sphingomonadales bacterium]